MTTWLELAALPKGATVRFVEPWDIFSENLVVPAGTRGVIAENSLNELCPLLWILPDDESIREKLREWGGCIELGAHCDLRPEGEDWQEESPLTV